MSSAPAQQSDGGAQHAASALRKLNLDQAQLVREFEQHYDISPRQIGFDSRSGEPIFDYDALSVLSLVLAPDIVNMETEIERLDDAAGVASVKCRVVLRDGRSRDPLGFAFVGEAMHDGSTIDDLKQALLVAQARAARAGLRAVGFNPVQAHARRMRGEDMTLNLSADPRSKDLATIHILREEAGLVTPDGDDTAYRNLLGDLFKDEEQRPIRSARDLDEKQRAQFIANLRSLKSVKERSLGSAHTTVSDVTSAERALHANAGGAAPRA